MQLDGSELRASPDLYPLAYDEAKDEVGFLRLTRARYREASFLDQRVALPTDRGWWSPFGAVRDAATALGGETDFIFHIGHVGSTLLARMMGLSPRVFSLREPGAMRTLAQLAFELPTPESLLSRPAFEERLSVFIKLWARTYDPAQKSLIKATSFVSEMASALLGRSPSSRAILMTVRLEVYAATILGGPNSRVELRSLASSRLRRLHRRLSGPHWRLSEMSEGEICAMSWAAETAGLADAADAFPSRVLWLDFEKFLAAPAEGLSAALACLHGDARQGDVEAMLKSALLTRYAKGPEQPYDAALRRQVLDQARREHGQEIARGVAWLERAAATAPKLAPLMSAAP